MKDSSTSVGGEGRYEPDLDRVHRTEAARTTVRPHGPALTLLKRLGIAGAAAALMILLATPGFAADEMPFELVWAHSSPRDVSRFLVFVSNTKWNEAGARKIDVGKPPSQPSGNLEIFSAIVQVAATDYVAIAAVGYDGKQGPLSSWSGVPPTRPGQPMVVEP